MICLGLTFVLLVSALAAVSAETVKYGSTGETVRLVQTKLKDLGYYHEAIDGSFGQALYTALWWFQKDKGLKVDGIAGTNTQIALGIIGGSGSQSAAGSLKYGAKGAAVLRLQIALKAAGYYQDALDGNYSDSTFTAVWQFQRDKGLERDGIAGAGTLEMLGIGYSQSAAVQLPGGKVLAFGSSGEYVSVLQAGLKNLGYFKGTVDGKFGNATYEAVWWFQRNNGLEVDGKVSTTTWSVLFSGGAGGSSSGGAVSGTLRYGDQGLAVLALQTRLKDLKYNPGTLDGIFGQNTLIAVRDFQQNNFLTADGVAGSRTLNALNSSSAVTNP